jgi:proteic killer suppression protein
VHHPAIGLKPSRAIDRASTSIRINAQWRICFVWTPFGPENVEIVDYR